MITITISVIIIRLAVKAARKRDIKGWKWGVPAGLFMYLIVFWDHIPTLIMHKYYCETEAGFWVYKTPEQWSSEDAGGQRKMIDADYSSDVMSTASVNGGLKEITRVTDQLGDLFEKSRFSFLPIMKIRSAVVNIENGQYLAESVNFKAGYGNFSGYGISGGSWKFWLNSTSCVIPRPSNRWFGLNDYRKLIYKEQGGK